MDQLTLQEEVAKALSILSRLENRVSRIEERLAMREETAEAEPARIDDVPATERSDREEELEYQVGQNWFAKAGIVILAIGMALLLTFPLEGLPSYVPALTGYVLVAGLFVLSHLWRESYPLLSKYLYGGGMALLYFATLRLFFFSPIPSLGAASTEGIILLLAVSCVIITLALRRHSHYLLALAITTAMLSALLTGSPWVVSVVIPLLAVFISYVRVRFSAPGLFLYGLIATFVTVLLWAMNNPLLGNPIRLVGQPAISVPVLLLSILAFGMGTLLRRDNLEEDYTVGMETGIIGILGYGVFLWLTGTAEHAFSIDAHFLASGAFLGLAVAFWVRSRSTIATFVFAMFGYLALSVAIVKKFESPDIFVWLSLQSVVVVATAVWFRSRFIVLANFIIYLVIIAAYLVMTKEESGIILVFGIVALLSARILNWQQHRLELKTGSMRNAYLGTAFMVFPYALYHLVPHQYVSLSWIGIALLYYLLNVVIKAQKYRWMGHLTLMLTVLYILIIGIIQLEPAYRLVSFLVLAIALLTVSMVFTRLRARKRAVPQEPRVAHGPSGPP